MLGRKSLPTVVDVDIDCNCNSELEGQRTVRGRRKPTNLEGIKRMDVVMICLSP
jgi:hypothetical protein